MNFYFAPMEGLTGYVYRNAHHSFFGNVTKYFSPFIAANQSESFKTRELCDILPENNRGITLVPQLLTNNASDFIHTAEKIHRLGYEEVNLNLGCPSGTVVSKNRGAGFLSQKKELRCFFDDIFVQPSTKISVKTRLGIDRPDEFYELLELYNQYPLEELIIHPRVQKDFYKNKPNLCVFQNALSISKNPVCYNGDIFSVRGYREFTAAFPAVNTVMLGRGLLTNPGLISEILQNTKLEKGLLRDFHDRLFEDYREKLSGDRNLLFKMKELWSYMIVLFLDSARYAKRINKCVRLCDYEQAVTDLFREQDILQE